MAIARTLLGGLTRALRGGTGLGKVIQEHFGYSDEDLEPRGLVEKIGQGVVSAIPGALLGGPAGSRVQSAIKSAPRIVAGQAASAGLENIGAPEWAQGLGQIAGEGAASYRGLKKAGKIQSLSDHTSQAYQSARDSLKKNEKGSGKAIKPFLDKVNNLWKKETDVNSRKVAEEIANTISTNVDRNGDIDILNAWENKQALNKQYRTAKPGERRYIEEARKGLEKVLKDHTPANPEFARNMSAADQLSAYKYTNNKIKDYFDNAGWIGKKIKYTGIPSVLNTIETVGTAALNPSARRYYANLTKSIIEDNKDNAKRYAIALNKSWIKQEEQESEGFEDIPFEDGFEEIN